MKCSCDAEIPLNEIVRRCNSCRKRICPNCMKAKVKHGQTFLCEKCVPDYVGRTTFIDNRIIGSATDGSIVKWAVLDMGDNVMIFEVNGYTVMGCNSQIEQVVRVVDKMNQDRFLSIRFHIGRVYTDDDKYEHPDMHIKAGTRNIKIIQDGWAKPISLAK